MAQKEEDLESLVKKGFSKLDFYSKHDVFEVTKDENENCFIEYYAKKSKTPDYNSYFKCSIELNFKQKSATWVYLWLDEKYRGKGWGGELVKKCEALFKKLDLSMAYVQSNINHEFWARMGYPTCLKPMKKSDEKSFYQYSYELLKALGVKNKKASAVVTENDERTFELSYNCVEDDDDLSFKISVDTKGRTATWTRMEAKKPAKIISKTEEALKSFGIKEINVEIFYFDKEEYAWEKAGYKKNGDSWYKLIDQ